MRKAVATLAVMFAVGLVQAEPTLTLLRVQQRYPWNGLVDVDYEIAGVTDPTAHTIDVTLLADGEPSVKGRTFLSVPATHNGTHRLVWDATADGASFASRSARLSLNLRWMPAPTDGDYMIVDISGGTNAPAYKVSYVSGIADPTNHFNKEEFKTSKIVFRKIRAGSFWMGSPELDPAWQSSIRSETRHYVTLTNDFFIGMFLLTAAQYTLVTGVAAPSGEGATALCALPCNTFTGEGGFLKTLNAKAICQGAAVSSFSLPTEAQWEYACRAGTETTWFFGSDPSVLQSYAWCKNKIPTGVGALLPNQWCLWDVYGYVNEFTADTLYDYPESTVQNPDVEPCHPLSPGGNFIVRGGASWMDATYIRSAYRAYTTPGSASTSNGYRLCLTCHGTGH